MVADDPWGADVPPATVSQVTAALPPRLAELRALSRRRDLLAGERWGFPSAEELPEVAALVRSGWFALDGAPLHACLPAVWPGEHRCWVPDRLPQVRHRFDGQRRWVEPWSPQDRTEAREHVVTIADECGLPPPPFGRIWLIRSPWPSIAVEVLLHLIGRRCDQRELPLLPDGFTAAARELVGWGEQQLWAWWPGPTGAAARAWRQRGRDGSQAASAVLAGLDPEMTGVLAEGGLTEVQAVAWAQALDVSGPAAVAQVPRWRALGLPPDPPPQLAGVAGCLTVGQVGAWLAAGFDLAAVEQLSGCDVPTALRWRAAGLSPEQTRQVMEADPTLTEGELSAFDTAGIDWPDQLAWIAHGFDADAAATWRRFDVTPMLARAWRSVGRNASDALAQADSGGVGLPPGIEVGWIAFGTDPRDRHYGVADPPGTRGQFAQEHRGGDHGLQYG